MRLLSDCSALITAAGSLGRFLGITLALLGGARAQTASMAPAYAWSAYPNAETILNFTTGVAVDSSDNVYASLVTNHTVVKISPAGTLSTLAGASGVPGAIDAVGGDARFNGPLGLAVDAASTIFVADFGNSTIRRISANGTVITLAGLAGVRGKTDGPPTVARFAAPRGIALDRIGNRYVTDWSNSTIRLITLDNHVQTVSGGTSGSRDSIGTAAQFMAPWGIAIDPAGNLFVTDSVANTVRRISAVDRFTSTLAGSPTVKGSADGLRAAARFNEPTGIALDADGNLFITDTQNHTIRRLAPDGQVTTIGGLADAPSGTDNGIGSAARFLSPYAVTVTSTGILYVADYLGIRRGEPVRAPTISTQPTGLTVRDGTRATLAIVASGAPAPTYQWRLDGVAIPDATAATLILAPARAQNAGNYTVVVTNALGSLTSSVATLVVNSPPKITAAPQPTVIAADGTAKLTVTATGVGPFTYQWLRNGDPVTGATNSSLSTTTYGSYAVTVTNAFGTSTSGQALVAFPSRLVNLSTSGVIAPGNSSLVSGLVVAAPTGTTKRLLIRAVGPSLARFGVTDALPLTAVTLLDQRGVVLARNSGWATNALPVYNEIADTAYSVGAFPLSPGSGDSALLVDVPRGNYTVSVEAAGTVTTGRSVLEIYEVDEDAARFTNLSTRGQLGRDGGLTVGFVAVGSSAPKLLVRATGPGLEQFGVTGAQQRPVLTVFSEGGRIATNTGWTTATNSTQIEQAASAVGAFPLARTSADSALLLTLTAGQNYTVEVSSADSTPGTVLVEIYQVP